MIFWISYLVAILLAAGFSSYFHNPYLGSFPIWFWMSIWLAQLWRERKKSSLKG